MKSLFIDTNIAIDLIGGDEGIARSLGGFERVYISTFVEGEFLTGIRNTAKGSVCRRSWERLMLLPTVERIHPTSETAEIYARLMQSLKDAGTPLPTNDVWIAAHVLENGSTLFTRDRHFSAIGALRTIA